MNGDWGIKSIVKAIPGCTINYEAEGNISGGTDAQLAWFINTDPNETKDRKEKTMLNKKLKSSLQGTLPSGITFRGDDTLWVKKSKNFVSNGEKKIKRLLKNWYFENADKYLKEITKELSQKYSLEFKSVKVRNYRSRWGSCSSTGSIFYNWKIIMTPKKICLLYTSPSPRDQRGSRMPSSA